MERRTLGPAEPAATRGQRDREDPVVAWGLEEVLRAVSGPQDPHVVVRPVQVGREPDRISGQADDDGDEIPAVGRLGGTGGAGQRGRAQLEHPPTPHPHIHHRRTTADLNWSPVHPFGDRRRGELVTSS
jgi:hypothetical protein